MTTTPAQHLDQVEHTIDVFRYLGVAAPAYHDWQVTCLFYAALHLVEAFLHQTASRARRTNTHALRSGAVRRLLPAISLDYERLKNQSEGARYELWRFTPAAVDGLYTGEFTRIRTDIHTALGLPL